MELIKAVVFQRASALLSPLVMLLRHRVTAYYIFVLYKLTYSPAKFNRDV